MILKLNLCILIRIQFIKSRDKLLSNTHQRLFRPSQEPINRTLIKQRGEVLSPLLELLSHWRETKHQMQIITNSVDEDLPELIIGGVVTFTLLLLELGLNVEQPDISIVLCD